MSFYQLLLSHMLEEGRYTVANKLYYIYRVPSCKKHRIISYNLLTWLTYITLTKLHVWSIQKECNKHKNVNTVVSHIFHYVWAEKRRVNIEVHICPGRHLLLCCLLYSLQPEHCWYNWKIDGTKEKRLDQQGMLHSVSVMESYSLFTNSFYSSLPLVRSTTLILLVNK